MSDFQVTNGPVSFRVKGLRKTVRALEKAGADATDMRNLMHEIGMVVVRDVNAPVLTGTLDSTIRAGRGKTKAVVRAGGRKAPYAGVQEYGNPYTDLPAQRYLNDALDSNRTEVFDTLDDGIRDILHKNDLT